MNPKIKAPKEISPSQREYLECKKLELEIKNLEASSPRPIAQDEIDTLEKRKLELEIKDLENSFVRLSAKDELEKKKLELEVRMLEKPHLNPQILAALLAVAAVVAGAFIAGNFNLNQMKQTKEIESDTKEITNLTNSISEFKSEIAVLTKTKLEFESENKRQTEKLNRYYEKEVKIQNQSSSGAQSILDFKTAVNLLPIGAIIYFHKSTASDTNVYKAFDEVRTPVWQISENCAYMVINKKTPSDGTPWVKLWALGSEMIDEARGFGLTYGAGGADPYTSPRDGKVGWFPWSESVRFEQFPFRVSSMEIGGRVKSTFEDDLEIEFPGDKTIHTILDEMHNAE